MITLGDFKTYRAIHSLSIPLYDQEGKPRADGKETLVQGGSNVELPDDFAQRALGFRAVRELSEDEQAELNPSEPDEESEVNGDPNRAENRLPKPAANASKADWVAYAGQEGLDVSGTRDEIQARVEQAEQLEAQ